MGDAADEKVRMTAAEYRRLPETTGMTELIHRELIRYGEGDIPSAKDDHQTVVSFMLAFLLTRFTPDRLKTAPLDVYLDDNNCVEPDIFWVSPDSVQCRLGEDGYWYGAPELIVEVLSPSTTHRDEGVKYDLYEKYGVQEYWIADPVLRLLKVFVRQGDVFRRVGVFNTEESFVSPILGGQTVEVKRLFPQMP
jgi:Uma2 family endonuclease